MNLHTSKIFVDSRYTLTGNGSSVEVAIPDGIELSRDAHIYLSEFTCVAAWDTLDPSNNRFYVVEAGVNRSIYLNTGPYDLQTLRDELEAQLNGTGKNPAMGTYTVKLISSRTGIGLSETGASLRYLDITVSSGVFKIPDNANIETIFGLTDPPSTNALFSWSTGNFNADSHASNFVDLRRVHSIYLHAPSFGAYSAVGPRGTRSILAKVPVGVGYGGLVQYHASGGLHEGMQCGVQALNILRFELRDVHGRLLDLRGTSWSMTLLLA